MLKAKLKTLIAATYMLTALPAFAAGLAPGVDESKLTFAIPPPVSIVAPVSTALPDTNPFDGFYIGATVKYLSSLGPFEYGVGAKDNEVWDVNLSGDGWGVYAGYGHVLDNNIYIAIEGNYQQFGLSDTLEVHNGCRLFMASIDDLINARVRVGYQTGQTLLYLHGGYSMANVSVDIRNVGGSSPTTVDATVSGFSYGAGLEYALGQNVKLRLEYTANDLNSVAFNAFNRDHSMDFSNQEILIGVGWTF